jgi:hypothetical protein
MVRLGRREGASRGKRTKEPATGKRQERCFTLEINHRPVLVFSGVSLRSAAKRVREDWFVYELECMRSNGRSILRPSDERLVRPAHPDEAAKLELERSLDEVRGEDTKYAFAFLIAVDSQPN